MARRKSDDELIDNPPPGPPGHSGLSPGEMAVKLDKPQPPRTPPRSAAAAAALRRDRLKRDLAKKRTQVELQRTSGQQGSSDRIRKQREEEEAKKFRRSRG